MVIVSTNDQIIQFNLVPHILKCIKSVLNRAWIWSRNMFHCKVHRTLFCHRYRCLCHVLIFSKNFKTLVGEIQKFWHFMCLHLLKGRDFVILIEYRSNSEKFQKKNCQVFPIFRNFSEVILTIVYRYKKSLCLLISGVSP